MAHFRHDSFSRDEGAPPGVKAVVQTPDGYLWLGARDGLWRFDGFGFEKIAPQAGSPFVDRGIRSLLVSRAGELWIGFYEGAGVAVLRKGRFVDTHLPDAPPQIVNLVEGDDGAIWAQWGGLQRRLWRFAKGRWQLMDGQRGLPAGYAFPMKRMKDGTLWLPLMSPSQASAGLAYLPSGARKFAFNPGNFQYPNVQQAPNGEIWVADRRQIARIQAPDQAAKAPLSFPVPPGVTVPDIAFDRWGGIWATTQTRGVLRVAGVPGRGPNPGAAVEQYRASDGLSADENSGLFIDRENNVWIAGEEGLDRFKFLPVVFEEQVRHDPVSSIHMVRSGQALIVASAGSLYRIEPFGRPVRLAGLQGDAVLCQSPDGEIWFDDGPALLSFGPAGARRQGSIPGHMAFGCVRDADRNVWVLTEDQSVWRSTGRGWQLVARGASFVIPGTGLAMDGQGRVAFVSGDRELTIAAGNERLRLHLPDGFGEIRSIDPHGSGFLVAMARGLVRIRDRRVAALPAGRYPWLGGILTSVDGENGVTWLYASSAIVEVRTRDLDAAFDHPGRYLPHRYFGSADGLTARAQHGGFVGPQAMAGGDGRLWVATSKGLAMLDPRLLPDDPGEIPVAFRSLSYGSVSLRDPVAPVLPAGTSAIRVAYSGMSLRNPERMTFRARLDGVDTDWVNLGPRRTATYANLGPGDYRFHVMAVAEDGTLGRHDAVLRFTIKPRFVQTWYFKALIAALVLLLAAGVYRIRTRAIAEGVRLRMAERHDERERIARELHDTLLQSINALMLHVGAAAAKLPGESPVREGLENALDRAHAAVSKGRERVENLRAPMGLGKLDEALRTAANELLGERIAWSVTQVGAATELCPLAFNEIVAMVREAFFNAARHAQATQVQVELRYAADGLAITVGDDGKGLPPAILESGSRPGHFGLVGIRERAAKLNGKVQLLNAAGGGLEVHIRLPAEVVFLQPPGRLMRLGAWLRATAAGIARRNRQRG